MEVISVICNADGELLTVKNQEEKTFTSWRKMKSYLCKLCKKIVKKTPEFSVSFHSIREDCANEMFSIRAENDILSDGKNILITVSMYEAVFKAEMSRDMWEYIVSREPIFMRFIDRIGTSGSKRIFVDRVMTMFTEFYIMSLTNFRYLMVNEDNLLSLGMELSKEIGNDTYTFKMLIV